MITIPEFYRNRDIFITGGTGLMGKVLIEKLLRSCPDLNKIFVLVRSKKGVLISDRIEKIKKLPLFDVLRETNPRVLDKIVAVEGDVKETNLGFTQDQYEILQNVSIIFHSAASVRFDDALKHAILLNTRGTYEVCNFATKLKKLDAFIHISTTYCNPHYTYVEEKVYPPHGDWRKVIQMAEKLDGEILDIFMKKYDVFFNFDIILNTHVIFLD
jgi:fatty acyl-CoA reductase